MERGEALRRLRGWLEAELQIQHWDKPTDAAETAAVYTAVFGEEYYAYQEEGVRIWKVGPVQWILKSGDHTTVHKGG